MDYAAWYLEAIVFFQVFRFSSRLRTELPWVFCWKLPPSSFFEVYWFIVLSVGLCCFHVIVFFLCICRVCSSIYKICVSWVGYFYWWYLHDSTFCRWAFTLPLSLPSCRTFTGALFRTALLFYFLLTITLQHYYFEALFHYSLILGEDDRLDTSVVLGCPSRSDHWFVTHVYALLARCARSKIDSLS